MGMARTPIDTSHESTVDTTPAGKAGKARTIVFFVLLALFALMHGRMSPLPYAVLGWFLEEGAVSHRVHEIAFGWIFVMSLAGLLAHVRRPEQRIAQMYQVAIALWLFVGVTLVVNRFFDPIIGAFLLIPLLLVALHPARAELLRPSFNVSKTLAVAAALAVVPLLVFSVVEFRIGLEASRLAPQIFEDLDDDATEAEFNAAAREGTSSNEELEQVLHFGHWSAMAAFSLIIAGLAALTAARPPGWRLPAWSAGLSAVIFGLASIANPGDASAINTLWAVLAIAWGIGFIIVAERISREHEPTTMAEPASA